MRKACSHPGEDTCVLERETLWAQGEAGVLSWARLSPDTIGTAFLSDPRAASSRFHTKNAVFCIHV